MHKEKEQGFLFERPIRKDLIIFLSESFLQQIAFWKFKSVQIL